MSDEDMRKARRKAAVSGDASDAASVERGEARAGLGLLGFLDELVGKQVYIEGARINYRGILRAVMRHGDGTPGGLLMEPCQRVSWFKSDGPQSGYTFNHEKPRLVPWEMVHDVGEEGFAEGSWK